MGDEMYYELYADSLFLVNFVMNLYLLFLVDRSFYRTATRFGMLLGAGAGALLYFLPFLIGGPAWFKYLVGVSAGSIVMLVIAFRIRSVRAFIVTAERLFLCAVLMGGLMMLFLKSIPWCRMHLVSVWGIMGMGAVLYLLLGYLGEKRLHQDGLCHAVLINGGSRMTVTALMDSGNSLVEPVSGKPVSVVEKGIVAGLWEEEPRFYRAVPYHSIGKRRGILKGYLLPELQIVVNGVPKVCRDTYIAVCEEYLTSEEEDIGTHVKIILNPLLLEDKRQGDFGSRRDGVC